MKEINVGLIGFGTIGVGVVREITANGDLIAQRSGIKLNLVKIADIDIDTPRNVRVGRDMLTTDANEILDNEDIDIVIELIGGTNAAKQFVLKALSNKKHVVTANKALISKCGPEIFACAEENGVDIYFEAAVGGCIPIIRSLKEAMVADKATCAMAILNGTCNYILTRMEREKLDFNVVLDQAQKLGYAEAEPSLDVDGHDTAQKLTIMSSIMADSWVDYESVHVEGIRDVTQKDIEYAAELGYRIKLLAICKIPEGKLEVRVHPCLLPLEHPLAAVHGSYNAVYLNSEFSDDMMLYGKGAGETPTAVAILSDVIDISRNIQSGCTRRLPSVSNELTRRSLVRMAEIQGRYYFRFTVVDKPGVLAKISNVLGDHGISISAVMQKARHTEEDLPVPVIIMSHHAKESSVSKALETIDQLDIIKDKTMMIRLEVEE
jgi:homoserine dehydrogenase